MGCRVVAWEPVPFFAAYLKYGLLLNNLTHLVELREAIAGNSSGGEATIVVPNRGIWGTAGIDGANIDTAIANEARVWANALPPHALSGFTLCGRRLRWRRRLLAATRQPQTCCCCCCCCAPAGRLRPSGAPGGAGGRGGAGGCAGHEGALRCAVLRCAAPALHCAVQRYPAPGLAPARRHAAGSPVAAPCLPAAARAWAARRWMSRGLSRQCCGAPSACCWATPCPL